MEGIEPCPFCGSLDYVRLNGDIFCLYWIHCDYCNASGGAYLTKAKAIAAWNRRGGGQDNGTN